MERGADLIGGLFEMIGACAAEVDNVGVHLPGVKFAKTHVKVGYISRKEHIKKRQEAWKDRREAAEVAEEAVEGVGRLFRKLRGAEGA
jgi:hypothetical protein